MGPQHPGSGCQWQGAPWEGDGFEQASSRLQWALHGFPAPHSQLQAGKALGATWVCPLGWELH